MKLDPKQNLNKIPEIKQNKLFINWKRNRKYK